MIKYFIENGRHAAWIILTFVPYAFAAEQAFLEPPRFVDAPDQNHALASRKFQGIPSLGVSPKGRLWATWYAGNTPGEDKNSGEWIFPASTWRNTDHSARVVVSTDKGQTFSLRGACHVPKEVRAFDEHMIVERKDKSLWMLVRTSYGIGESTSNDRGKTWSDLTPSPVEHPSARFFIRRLHSGNLLLVKHGPIAKKTGRSHLTAYLSKDDGRMWSGGLVLDERSGVSYPDGQQREDGTIHIIYDYSRTADREILMATFTEHDVVRENPASAGVSLRMVVSKP